MTRSPIFIMGHQLHPASSDDAVTWIQRRCADGGQPMSIVHTLNVDHVAIGRRNRAFRTFMSQADLTLADGAPLAAAASVAGFGRWSRVTGQDLFDALAKDTRTTIPTYLLGSTARVNRAAFEKLQTAEFPGFAGVGRRAPSPEELDDRRYNDDLIAEINQSGAALVVVTLGRHVVQSLEAPPYGSGVRRRGGGVDHVGHRSEERGALVLAAGVDRDHRRPRVEALLSQALQHAREPARTVVTDDEHGHLGGGQDGGGHQRTLERAGWGGKSPGTETRPEKAAGPRSSSTGVSLLWCACDESC